MPRESVLERAWQWRANSGALESSQALRVFHGPGEGQGAFQRMAIDRFGTHYWLTWWEKEGRGSSGADEDRARKEAIEFLSSRGASSVVELGRPEKGVPAEPRAVFGEPPTGRFEVSEIGKYWIQLLGARHPGLFLDHEPLRRWLRANARGWKVLNLFAYTGSLSVAAALGRATQVTTLDLSGATIDWARENWKLNGFEASAGRFIAGDVFEWLPRLEREKSRFDCIILDPPSFSRGKKGTFSTSKDLGRLHDLAFPLLEEGGVVCTSINSAQIPRAKFDAEVFAAARARKRSFEVLHEISQPETFPSLLGQPESRYLKGLILRSR